MDLKGKDWGILVMKIEAQNTPYCLGRANVTSIEILPDFIDFVIVH